MDSSTEDDHVQVLYPIDDDSEMTTPPLYNDFKDEKSNEEMKEKNEGHDEFTFTYHHFGEFQKLNLWFKIHAAVGFMIGLILMLVWHWTKATAHWWFIYPFAFFMFTTAIHYSIIKNALWNIFYAFLWIGNVTLILAWATHKSMDGHYRPYPIFVIFPSLLVRSLVEFIKRPHNERNMFRFLINCTWTICAFLFVIWIFYGEEFPWFFIPAFVLFTPIIIYRLRFIDKEKKIWPLLAVVVGMTSLLTFFIWMFTTHTIPWFPIPAIIGIPIVIFVARKERSAQTVSSTPPPNVEVE